jgi:serine protease Do
MRRWITLLGLSLAVGVGLTWLARPLELEVKWGDRPDQAASVSLREATAQAEWTAEEKAAISGAETLSKAFVAISKEVLPSVVTIYSERLVAVNPQGDRSGRGMPEDFFHFFGLPDQVPQRGMGSGVIIQEDGLILTNNHVVAGADRVRVNLSDGRDFDAKVLGRDPKTDIAVLRIEASGLPAARMGSSDALEVGEWVLAVGSPFQLNQTVTQGIVSAKGRSSVGLADYEDFIQTDAAINPGNSGGALVNLRGEVVGVNTAIATRTGGYQGVGFAIPIDMARKITDSLVRNGRVVRGFLGIQIQDVDAALAENLGLDKPQGALVTDVTRGQPAAEAGIKTGDLIVELDGQPVRDRDALRLKVGETQPGTDMAVTVLRDGGRKTIKVHLAEFPRDEETASNEDETQSAPPSLDKLGFTVERLDRLTRQRYEIDSEVDGLIVTEIDLGSPASDAGLREGDLILEAGKEAVNTVSELRARIDDTDVGETLLLKVRRGSGNIFLALRVPKS